jgi:type VI secretion system secreted protein Hcp
MAEIDDRTETERLRAQLAAQEAEIARLRRAAEGGGSTRREVLKSAGLIAGVLAAAAAVVGTAGSKEAAAVEGHNIRNLGTPAYLFLKANGSDIQGESSVPSLGRQNSIETMYFQWKVSTVRDASTGQTTGRRQYQPIVIRKRIDKSTPLLLKALCNNEVAEGTFKFFRPNPSGDGTTEHYYTVEIKQGRISGVNQYDGQANDMGAGGGAVPTMEEVQFTFNEISWTYENGGITFEDSLSSTA